MKKNDIWIEKEVMDAVKREIDKISSYIVK